MLTIKKIRADHVVDFAAEELKKYLRMMMPRCGEIPIAYRPDAVNAFRLGLMTDLDLDISDAADPQKDDIIYISTDKEGGIIAGSNPGALLIAVYRYLRFCGCRWLFPGVDGEWIPTIDSLPAVSYRKLADHRYRGQCNEGAEYQQNMLETIDFTPKIGMNTYMLEFDIPSAYYNSYYNHDENTLREPEPINNEIVLQWKRQCEVEIQKRGLHYHDMGHGWTAEPFGIDSSNGLTRGLIRPKVDFIPEESFQYLAQVNGIRALFRRPLDTNICMSNPKARQIMSEYIADYAAKQNNVDYLHIWLSDGTHNHCECDNCRKKTPSDWYVMLLNETDKLLTKRGLDTHLVFIVYTETFWAPKEEKLNNPDRFTMLFAPISRTYTETYGEDADLSRIKPFQLNNNHLPDGMSACLGYLKEWQKLWSGDTFCYEYHFWRTQYYDPSGMYLARLLYDDIRALKKQGLSGIVEDGSQRSYFPTGFPFYVYGETLYDSSVSFEELTEDYFSHAFGENWREVVRYLENIRDHLDFAFLSGLCSADKTVSPLYNPAYATRIAETSKITAAFAPVIAANINQPRRAASVAWRLLREHIDQLNMIAAIAEKRALGDDESAASLSLEMIDEFSRREIALERYYDHFLFIYSCRGKLIPSKNLNRNPITQ